MKKIDFETLINRVFCKEEAPIDDVRVLLERGVHPDKIVRASDKTTLLAYMSKLPRTWCNSREHEFIALYQELVARGANVNKAMRGGATPLGILIAASGSNNLVSVPLLKCLIEAGATLNGKNSSPICCLIGFGSLKGEIFGFPFRHAPGTAEYETFWSNVQLLLDAGVDINAFEQRGLYNPLLMAAYEGAADAVTRFIALGADPNVINRDGNTALMYAAGDADGLASIVAGISCSWRRDGDTLAVTRTLLDNGANPTLANNRRRTALSIAQRNECHDVAFELAQALAQKAILTTKDVKAFKGTPFELQAYALQVVKHPKKASTSKDTSGSAQLITWGALPKASSEQPFAAECALVCTLLDAEIKKKIYADYWGLLGGALRLSTTKSWLSRRGCIIISRAYIYEKNHVDGGSGVSVSTRFMVQHEALNQDSSNTEIRAEYEIPMGADGMPDAGLLKEALITMLQTQLNVTLSA